MSYITSPTGIRFPDIIVLETDHGCEFLTEIAYNPDACYDFPKLSRNILGYWTVTLTSETIDGSCSREYTIDCNTNEQLAKMLAKDIEKIFV